MAAVAVTAALLACSPTFNWREVRLESTGLKAMFPCKPDHATRNVTWRASRSAFRRWAATPAAPLCRAVRRGGPGLSRRVPGPLAGGDAGRAALRTRRRRPCRSARRVRSTCPSHCRSTATASAPMPPGPGPRGFFRPRRQVFQAVVYADALRPEFTDPFFSGPWLPMSLLARRTAIAVFLAFAVAYFFSALLRCDHGHAVAHADARVRAQCQRPGPAGGRLFFRLRR